MERRNLLAAVALAGAVVALTGVSPQPPQDPGRKGLAACRKDIRRYCREVTPGEGRIGACLHERLEELSKACRRFAAHGGPGHELESLKELDEVLAPRPAAPPPPAP